ncbi:PadR family transcriptional regulator [Abyssisolibacter fermentans]|uniref:PadR family transcriptional regulator n=1 Tax=Abyssisolibacter fermentans TaxID=1766203 RepID=UPI00082E87D5|nr:PadR family transcriptional regulator [Abyssisolibacter fermentans]
MPKINKTQYAILGVLSISPKSGYNIKKFIESSIGYFWNENYGHIYPILKRLEQEELVVKKTELSETRPNSNIYSITEKGKKKLLDWLSEPIQKSPVRDEMLFKLFFGANVSIEENVQRILAEKEKAIQYLKALDSIERSLHHDIQNNPDKSNELMFRLMTLRRGQYNYQTHITWCDECLEILHKMKERS